MSTPTKATEALITIDAVTQEAENRLRHPYCSGERRMDFRHGADWAISVYEPERQRLIALLADMEGEAHPSPTTADAKDSPVTYAMSRDYSALYDLLCAGGEAFVRVPKATMVAYWTKASVGDMGKQEFISRLTAHEFEWIAPVDVQEVIRAGDELTKIKGALCNFILSLAPRDRDGHFTKDELDHMTTQWTNATKPFRP